MLGTSDALNALGVVEFVVSGLLNTVDCVVYLAILARQLIRQVGFWRSVNHIIQALPFLFFGLPLSFIHGPTKRSSVRRSRRHPDDILVSVYHDAFAQTASISDVAAVRCMRWGVENLPIDVSRIFLSNNVAISYWLWQKWRSPITRDVRVTIPIFSDVKQKFSGIWVKRENNTPPEIVLYYIHGGGFAQGSAAFFLPWLAAWLAKLEAAGYQNPAIFAIDYSLAPEVQHPVQIRQVLQGYQHVVSIVGDESQICMVADSAGAFLAMSLMTAIGSRSYRKNDLASDIGHTPNHAEDIPYEKKAVESMLESDFKAPGMVILISPWLSLVSSKHHATASDYITPERFRKYAEMYAPGISASSKRSNSKFSGPCLTPAGVSSIRPKNGYIIWYGEEEVLANDIQEWITILRTRGSQVTTILRSGGIHVWPVASFLIRTRTERLDDLDLLVDEMRRGLLPRIKAPTDKKSRKSRWGLEYTPAPVASREKHEAPATGTSRKPSLLDKRPSRSVSNAESPRHNDQKEISGEQTHKESEEHDRHHHHHHSRKRFSLRRDRNRGVEGAEVSVDANRKETESGGQKKDLLTSDKIK
ncbi:hypothetical protein CFIMG_001790RA [Ceratocystis fimbriata CBS 114723]|uniref:Alpha/beta hydrolase fold-3 domain-containing protein n=1 Tax=Ceratocystis fimbriata CBS 114723 TaxID=1035309 RepID=A0A2C5WXJ9_9PEZI|nr:hypothetical protein CFIMG_001790RA [Ceratocystis fimbriata CBS 114723]